MCKKSTRFPVPSFFFFYFFIFPIAIPVLDVTSGFLFVSRFIFVTRNICRLRKPRSYRKIVEKSTEMCYSRVRTPADGKPNRSHSFASCPSNCEINRTSSNVGSGCILYCGVVWCGARVCVRACTAHIWQTKFDGLMWICDEGKRLRVDRCTPGVISFSV